MNKKLFLETKEIDAIMNRSPTLQEEWGFTGSRVLLFPAFYLSLALTGRLLLV